MDTDVLNNPIWHALAGEHKKFSVGGASARRYAAEVAPFAALREDTEAAHDELAQTMESKQIVALFTVTPPKLPNSWKLVKQRPIDQMVCKTPSLVRTFSPVRLATTDIAEMTALAETTDPGPFSSQTISMGSYFGIRTPDGALVAMAGVRLSLPRHAEISAVCTHPNHRGQGHARSLVEFLSTRVLREGRTPFLHVKGENSAARVYERAGFSVRRTLTLTVISKS